MSAPSDAGIPAAPSSRDALPARQVRALERIASLMQVAAVAAAALVVFALGEVVVIAFAAVLAAVMLRGAASRLGRVTRIGTGWGLVVVVVLLVASVGGLGWGFGPSLVHQAKQVQDVAGEQLAALRAQMDATEWGRSLFHQLPFHLGEGADAPASPTARSGAGSGIGSALPHLAGVVAGALWSALGLVGTVTVIAAAAIYLAASPATYVRGLARLMPARLRPQTHKVLNRVGNALRGWLLGQFFDMLIVGVLCGVGLALLGVPLAFILALIAALTSFVPYVGAIAGAIPAVLIAFSLGGSMALDVALLYFGVQMLEGNVIAPLIQQRAVDLPPALTIVAQTALGLVFGLFGVVLATPLTAAIIAAVQAATDEDLDAADGRGVAAP